MFSDSHIHSWFSGDSNTDPEKMILKAIELNMNTLTFTEHMDFNFPLENLDFTLDSDKYFNEINLLKDKYKEKIEILIGLESGLESRYHDKIKAFALSKPFDFIIGSTHLVNGRDPYSNDYFEGRSDKEGFNEYFLATLDNLKNNEDFDVYGHIDYIVRYSPNKNENYSYFDFIDIIDEILITIIEMGKGIEINTAGYKYGLNSPNPDFNVIKKYKELGGEIITIGSDAHSPEHIGFHFNDAVNILKMSGFKHCNIFKERKPIYIDLV